MSAPAPTPAPTRVFDGHNDVLTRLLMAGGTGAADAFLTGLPLHVDLPKARRGGLAGGLFAVWVPSSRAARGGDGDRGAADPAVAGTAAASYERRMSGSSYDLPLPAPLERAPATDVVMREIAILHRLETIGALRVCTDVPALRRCVAEGTIAAVLHLEGAEAIDPELHALDVLYRAGLRSLGPVWSRDTAFGHGVPFRFPSGPDIGPGLTDAGLRLVRRCNELGVLVDLSHLNEAGFDDVARVSDAPLVATHSNAHAVCPHARNLTDRQLEAVAASGGVVGLNFATAFLREDGRMSADTPVATMLRHLDHLLERLGERGVALGSDFDGAVVPAAIGDAAGLPVLVEAMRAHGYGEALVARICLGNWLDVLERTWTAAPGSGRPAAGADQPPRISSAGNASAGSKPNVSP